MVVDDHEVTSTTDEEGGCGEVTSDAAALKMPRYECHLGVKCRGVRRCTSPSSGGGGEVVPVGSHFTARVMAAIIP